jgi:hypothetical protein
MTVEDAVSAQSTLDIPAFAKPTFERFRRTRHSAQYFDPDAAPITEADASPFHKVNYTLHFVDAPFPWNQGLRGCRVSDRGMPGTSRLAGSPPMLWNPC